MAQAAFADTEQLDRLAGEAFERGDFASARGALEQLLVARPDDVGAAFGLAIACRALGDGDAKLAALDRVLGGDPRHLLALMMKGDHFDQAGDGRSAQAFYQAVLTRAPPSNSLPPPLRDAVRRAAAQVEKYKRDFEARLMASVARAGFDPAAPSGRFGHALDLMLGRKRIYPQAPTTFYFPELPQRQFFERSEFSWLAALEAQTSTIREELEAMMGDADAFRPYLETLDNRPPPKFDILRDNTDWGAYYLIRGGKVEAETAARFPATMAALDAVPLCRVPGRTPSVLFSRLSPRTRIPPHHGQINARLICHLPLIVPPGCGLRVGNETRSWVEGKTLIFDDSIEHDAWNDSDRTRVVLLFDIWRPELSDEELSLIATLLAAVADRDEL
jgi:aspartyl/asparaginyl beta-hydroxylase (cupin superfamily)